MSQAAQTSPSLFTQAMSQAVKRHQAGQIIGAEQYYREALEHSPNNGDALRLLGGLLLQNNRFTEAEALLRQALSAQPSNSEIAQNLGLALSELGLSEYRKGDIELALPYLREAVELAPHNASALGNLGLVLHQVGNFREAENNYRRVLQMQPDSVPALVNLASVLRDLNERETALALMLQAQKLRPDMPEVAINLGTTYLELRKFDLALMSFNEALRLSPNNSAAIVSRGIALSALGRPDEAEQNFRDALAVNPHDPQALMNLGWYARDQGRLDEALAFYDRALAVSPKMPAALYRKGIALLMRGDYAEGWRLYEAGRNQPNMRGIDPFTAKPWNGIKVKRLMIWSEQGLGDSLHFVRYAALCKAFAEQVIVQCPQPLLRLYQNSPGIDAAYEDVHEDMYDAQISMMSLPYRLGTTLNTVPAAVPYLGVAENCQRKWSARIKDDGRLKVGLVWAGDARKINGEAHLIDRRRSMHLSGLRALFAIKGVQYYSLQKGPSSEQIDYCGLRDQIIDLMPGVEDFMDTAAIANNLDLVIAVDTSVAHLAGGLGKPVWILSRFDACWRWLQNRPDSPWYPTARIFGQPKAGDWASVVEAVAAALKERIAASALF